MLILTLKCLSSRYNFNSPQLVLMLLNWNMMFCYFFENVETFIFCSLASLYLNKSKTRWSKIIQAVLPIVKHYPSILKALDLLLEDKVPTLTLSARNTVLGLKKYYGSLKGLLISLFLHKILASLYKRKELSLM